MQHYFRLVVGAILGAAVILLVAIGLAHHDRDLLAPFDMFLTLLVIAVYLLPTGLAFYRDCKGGMWIAALNMLLGWTIFGWFIALGWAAAAKPRPIAAVAGPQAGHPVTGD